MERVFGSCLMAFCLLLGGGLLGWAMAHHEVETECIRQGGFYVDDKDFECKLKGDTP